ncbi:MAG: DUF5106 domain-containing protein [Bacteroidia bacterium]|nr:DUF5106 domain-containing protein [Bacteroidia bacterium]
MRKYFLLFIISFLFITLAFPQGYDIKIKINGLKDTTVLLGYYLADKKYVIDTARVNKEGICNFKKNKKLDEGLYLIILPNKTFLDFPVTDVQDFALLTDTGYLLMNLKIKGSKENQIFSDYQKNMIYNQKLSMDLKKRLSLNKNIKDSVKLINDKLVRIKKEVDAFNNKIISENPKSFTAHFIRGTQEIEVPDPPRDEKGNVKDSLFQYRYYKQHYFDNTDFSDDRLMRTPFLQSKIESFFKKTVLQVPDSIIAEIDKLILKAKANDKMLRFVTAWLLNSYETSKYMGMENVFVDIADKYYLSGQAAWADSSFLRKLKDRVSKMRHNLMGKTAPDLKRLETSIGEWATLSLVKAKLTILVFWEPNCSHCKKVIPKLHEICSKYKNNSVSVFAVYTQHDTTEWNKFIEEHGLTDWLNVYDRYNLSNFRNLYDIFTTPTLYILDEKKTIIARKIDVEAIEKFLTHFVEDEMKKK